MASIKNPKNEVMHRSYFLDLKPMRFNMMIFYLGLGEFSKASIETPIIENFMLACLHEECSCH
jgi:hypothetical protein